MQQVPLASQSTPDASGDRDNAQRISALVQQAKLGDVEAFATLYRLHALRIYDYAARRLAGKQEAEEATEEIFFRAFRGIAGCRDNAGFTGWLFGIARFVIADVHRGRGRQHQPLGLTDDPEDPEPPPEEQFLRHERGQALRAARESCLASRERDLFDLLLADLTDREIATALGRPYGAIRTAHWRLLTKLRSCLTMQDAGKGGPHVVS